jgi:plastocyanin
VQELLLPRRSVSSPDHVEESMSRTVLLAVTAALAVSAHALAAAAQSAGALPATAGSHLITVQLIESPGSQYAFQPAAITAQRGDTVRFVQASGAPHDVDFKKMPKGAKITAGEAGPYLIDKGQSYNLVIDGRFVDGTYEFVCDPHEGVGMKGTLVVGAPHK